MESHSSSSSFSSSMYSSQYQNARKSLKLSNSFNSALHSVRKSQHKPSKKPIAPLPPTPPKVYNVNPIDFRDLVQQLTGATAANEPPPPPNLRLHQVAPPPLDITESQLHPAALVSSSPVKAPFLDLYQEMMADTSEQSNAGILELDSVLSPTSWCSLPLLSPGSLSTFDQSTLL